MVLMVSWFIILYFYKVIIVSKRLFQVVVYSSNHYCHCGGFLTCTWKGAHENEIQLIVHWIQANLNQVAGLCILTASYLHIYYIPCLFFISYGMSSHINLINK